MNNKKIVVISLGGSLIIPNEVDIVLLQNFRSILKKQKKSYKFVVVCGGGSIARKYMAALQEDGKSEYMQSLIGISTTRTHARFLGYLFGELASVGVPHDMKQVRNLLKKNDILFCGALRYAHNETSDSTSAKLANYLKSEFINLTNVPGLYDKNPSKLRDAKFIPCISWREFSRIANKLRFRPGQHFVLDQHAAQVIAKNRIKTYILGSDMNQLDNLLSGKKFIGTVISG
jgi:uridylate kinase